MASIMGLLFVGLLKLLIVAGVALYAGLVLMSYRTDGPHLPLKVGLADPARSAERLAVWLGVKIVATALRGASAVFNILAEASADVGEWVIRHRSAEAQATFRSRFMA
jgi:hypothetical protein